MLRKPKGLRIAPANQRCGNCQAYTLGLCTLYDFLAFDFQTCDLWFANLSADTKENLTNFPKRGGNQKISLRNSQYPQADYDYVLDLKENWPQIWKAGGNIRGNQTFVLWGRARQGGETQTILNWIREREAWFARHYNNGGAIKRGDSPTLSNVAGIVAWLKWGGYGQLGAGGTKRALNTLKTKLRET